MEITAIHEIGSSGHRVYERERYKHSEMKKINLIPAGLIRCYRYVMAQSGKKNSGSKTIPTPH